MKLWTMAGAGLVMMGAVGVAMAQAPAGGPAGGPAGAPAGAPPAPGADGPPMHGPMGPGGPGGGWRRHMAEAMHMHRPPPPSKAAHFRFRKDGAMVDIKCADDEPTKACVDAGSALLDKLAAQK